MEKPPLNDYSFRINKATRLMYNHWSLLYDAFADVQIKGIPLSINLSETNITYVLQCKFAEANCKLVAMK